MQVSNSSQSVSDDGDRITELEEAETTESLENCSPGHSKDNESVFDISGKSLEFSSLDRTDNSVEGLYLYKNVFHLIPRSVGNLGRLKTLKFFANEINLFPSSEFQNLLELEFLQVKLSSPGLTGLPLQKLKALKELELCKVPPRPSAFPVLSEIAGLRSLTKLSVCHFSLRFIPSEIGCLDNLEHLDLSFNKIKSLPTEISYLKVLKSLKVANNKLVELPSHLSALQKLQSLDLSNNRLTSLGALELVTMRNLRNLYLQYNKLLSCCQIPSWICCNLEGNSQDASHDEYISSSVEMDVLDGTIEEIDGVRFCDGSSNASTSLAVSQSNSRSFVSKRSSKGWKRRYFFQQRARQERLNNSRKKKGEVLTLRAAEKCKPCKILQVSEGDNDSNELPSGDEEINTKEETYVKDGLCLGQEGESESGEQKHGYAPFLSHEADEQDEESSSSEAPKSTSKSKRHCDTNLDNPKPCKSLRPAKEDYSNLSSKYSSLSFCEIEDRLPDGFYDAGREQPFMSLQRYEQILQLDLREVILVDREQDEELDAIVLTAKTLVSRLKQLNRKVKHGEPEDVDQLQIASFLALFVSDHFGGSDRSSIVERARKSVSGSNYLKPFVCTCATGNSDTMCTSTSQILSSMNDIAFIDLCEKSLRTIKESRGSIVVPIGMLQFGVCRHRALLMKYLCDRMGPPVPCELIRGYLNFLPHAWNVIIIKKGDSWVRMVVDACRPHDIREETDPEYFCRYIPLSRINIPLPSESFSGRHLHFPSLSACEEIEKAASSSLIRCKLRSVEAAAKVRTLEVSGTSTDQVKNFEYTCLGEVRILGALRKHSCIVEIYGHQITSKWAPSVDRNLKRRILQSAIFMEYIKGGSLKSYIEKLSEAGENHVPMDLALFIARDVACALAELHSKDIIHRDIKSENILIDLDSKKSDGTPIVKLCDFDRAIPLRSFLHTCCIAHVGIPPPDACVGTPRWMAPEVLRAMGERKIYGLEVDIWSFGCLLLELLTLQVPYSGLSESDIHSLLERGERPGLTEELEALRVEARAMGKSNKEMESTGAETETLRFLIGLFCQCTEENPSERPTAENLHKMLLEQTSSFTNSSN